MKKLKLLNKRGMTLLQLLVVGVAIIALTTMTVGLIMQSNSKKEQAEISSNISQLESSAKTYFTNKNQFPVKEAVKLSETTKGTPMRTFFDEMVKISGLPKASVDSRMKVVDFQTLKTQGYLSSSISDPDDYVLDKKTGKVYNIHRNAKKEDIKEIVKKVISDAGDIIDLNKNTEFALQKDGKSMTRVIATATQGNKMIVGGDGSMKVAVVSLSDNKGKVSNEITDLTGLLKGTAPSAVTELVVVDNNKVLVHYYDGKDLAYQTIDF